MSKELDLIEGEFSENAIAVLERRYLRKDKSGKPIETPMEMFWRVARNIALMDILYHPQVYSGGRQDGAEADATRDGAEQSAKQAKRSKKQAARKLPGISDKDWATLKMAFERFESKGLMKVSWPEMKQFTEANEDYILDRALEFYKVMVERKFMPNSPALMNAGRDLQQLSACFVLPVDDSMVSIFDSLKHAALIHQSGGGTGFSFSRLRPKNDVVRSTGGVASGPVSFMKVFNAATEAVKQGGVRRGANMGILRVDHPDILEFITCKTDTKELNNFNISVGITEKFMQAVEAGEDYELINPRNRKVTGKLNAREVFEKIVDQAWRNGEPGIVFLDRLNKDNPTPELGEIESTNPCGEQPLLPYEACCLGSINLGAFTRAVWQEGLPGTADPDLFIDWKGMADAVRLAVHFLDNLIDANKYPLPEIDNMSHGNRKIGLGVMGWADMLLDLGIPYNSEQAVKLAEQVMEFIEKESVEASKELAKTRGVFPNWEKSIYADKGIRLRNATTTTIAPTGTISIIAGASSGIEPLFSIAFTRNVLDNKKLVEVNPRFQRVAEARGFYSQELMEKIAEHGTLHGISEVPDDVKRIFVTAHEITPEWHVKMQAAFQKYTHNAVSKTVNFRREATREDVRDVFIQAYKLGCKGVTVYRDGSREEQVLTVGAKTVTDPAGAAAAEPGAQHTEVEGVPGPGKKGRVNGVWGRIRPIERPATLEGFTTAKETPVGKLFLTLNALDGHPVELFAQIGKAGSDVAAFTEAIARLISIALRSGIDPQEIADQLMGIGGSRSIGFGPNRVRSVPDAIGQFIDEYVNHIRKGEEEAEEEIIPYQDELPLLPGKRFNLCPTCGTWNLVHVEGCQKCLACGYSEC
ncbi:MAG: vitamin B12-dependent ribonucleotide reductase [Bacillota bacterium]|nr:vitamin B12-dependent ribonucleotide reductase [Bacillota bacterium]HPT35887.1 vitamin B12-dependent ribonucleotide reductase [Bacillota bacterium]HQD85917.1 vitamin B12-dependent ribonucleotide reductase [Bacillota bacterium]